LLQTVFIVSCVGLGAGGGIAIVVVVDDCSCSCIHQRSWMLWMSPWLIASRLTRVLFVGVVAVLMMGGVHCEVVLVAGGSVVKGR